MLELPQDDPGGWAPIHARRALGMLGIEAAIEPLLSMLSRIDDEQDEWIGEEVPEIFARLGPVAVDPLIGYLKDLKHKQWARVATINALGKIARKYPEQRALIVAELGSVLTDYRSDGVTVNTFIIMELADLRAREHANLVSEVVRSGRTDPMAFDWDDICVPLGLPAKNNRPSARTEFQKMKLNDAIDSALGRSQSLDPFDEES
ncbi:MAG TPA: hypothetical protein VL282_12450 [Tepidisphaeraceae bacterium]|nr:hypothetical protein [Tepidisphaeraceae bacterium]